MTDDRTIWLFLHLLQVWRHFTAFDLRKPWCFGNIDGICELDNGEQQMLGCVGSV